jgi:hypothetical protein
MLTFAEPALIVSIWAAASPIWKLKFAMPLVGPTASPLPLIIQPAAEAWAVRFIAAAVSWTT